MERFEENAVFIGQPRLEADGVRWTAVLEHSQAQATLNALQLAVVVVDRHGNIIATNSAWRHLAEARGMSAATSWLGAGYLAAHRAVYGDGSQKARSVWAGVQAVLVGDLATFHASYTCAFPPETRHFELSVTPLADGHSGAVVTHRDVTDQEHHEAELLSQANHDPLTGLPNRRLFFLEADKVLALARRHQHVFTLLYLDLDGFKEVNDSNGHAAGDEVLCQVAMRLKGLLRESDLIARLGGDEFLVLFQETDLEPSLEAANRFQRSLEQPFKVGNAVIRLRGSFGMARYPHHGHTLEDLVRCADRAMYQAKAAGGGIRVC